MAADGSRAVAFSGEAAGLVHSKTSDRATYCSVVDVPWRLARLRPAAGAVGSAAIIEIDRNASRARRLKKSVITGARLHVNEATASGFRGRWAMFTATYREECDAGARDVSALLKRLRCYFDRACLRRFGRGGPVFRYVWVLELTKRLRPHYHLLVWFPFGVRYPLPDQAGWWKHGLTNVEWARNAVGYLAKYASKFVAGCVEALPKGLRTHGLGGLNPESKRELRWWKAPTDAREALGETADIRKAKGGYFDKRTGEFWPSPWHVFITPDGRTYAWKDAA